MMVQGISTNRDCSTAAAQLLGSGIRFVFRYHSTTTQQAEKRLSPKEAAEVARAGLDLATVYQDRARQTADFGRARGEQDGAAAIVFAGQVGQPAGSAVYFAVDVDFSESQLRQYVLPYFQGVKAAFDAAAGGAAYLRIGVYGSGLTCRLLRAELAFVTLSWLAESTGWRESKTYAQWQVRQHLNGGNSLPGLGTDFERCDASVADFGQFRPVGHDLRQGEGETRHVAVTMANLRRAPTTKFNEPIVALPKGQAMQVLGASAPGWVRVRTTVGGSDVIGHIADKLLTASGAPAPTPAVAPVVTAIPAVHLRADQPAARRNNTGGRAYPLSEAGRPTRAPGADGPTRIQQLQAIADWLDVEHSARYAPLGVTFCNIYATDYAYLAQVYLPRVWWTGSALMAFAKGQTPEVVYEQTVREMRADDLYQWLVEFGPGFGWRRVFDASALQACANAGGVGVICADREAEGRPGHITVVVPEDASHRATHDPDGHVTDPLQSQAGARNHRYGSAGPSWWRSAQFKAWGFFVHD
jgi:hypothetical protein